MMELIAKLRDPLASMLGALHGWVTTNYPDTVVSGPDSVDKEGWIDYAVADAQGNTKPFVGVRFRRDKPTGVTVVLAARPEHDPMEWVHVDMSKVRPMGFALGLPRPFEKSLSDESKLYLFDLVTQSRKAVSGSA